MQPMWKKYLNSVSDIKLAHYNKNGGSKALHKPENFTLRWIGPSCKTNKKLKKSNVGWHFELHNETEVKTTDWINTN